MLLGTLIYGFVNSAILALLAMGFNLTFGISGVANFAYGAVYIFSGFSVWILLNTLGIPYLLAVLIAIVLAALMGLAPIYVMTHDSIGLGEDGPTHEPIEHLSQFRALPNFYVWRPADATENVEAWKTALEMKAPHGFVLSRQKLKTLKPKRDTHLGIFVWNTSSRRLFLKMHLRYSLM